jgi:hypothetical protein
MGPHLGGIFVASGVWAEHACVVLGMTSAKIARDPTGCWERFLVFSWITESIDVIHYVAGYFGLAAH